MSRGILTKSERQAVRGEEEDDNKRSTYLARVRKRLKENVREDARILREHRPDLYEELHAAVCEEEQDERIERLEEQIETLQEQVNALAGDDV